MGKLIDKFISFLKIDVAMEWFKGTIVYRIFFAWFDMLPRRYQVALVLAVAAGVWIYTQ